MKYIQTRAFIKHLEGASPKQFSPIYLILTKNEYERKHALDSLLTFLLPASLNRDLCLKYFDGDSLQSAALFEELGSLSFFSAQRVVVIQNADKMKKTTMELVEKYFASPNPAVYLVLAAAAINHNTTFYKAAEKAGVALEIAEEKPWEKEKSVMAWMMQRATENRKTMAAEACQVLLKHLGTDQTLLHNELEKLFCYVGERTSITMQDVHAICSVINTETIWQLGEAIFRRDAPAALRIGKALLEESGNLIGLLKQIRHQFQTHFQICCLLNAGGGATEVSQAYPYMRGAILERNMQLAQRYGMYKFKQGILSIDEAELAAKNSGTDPEVLAEMLIIRLI